MIVPQQQLFIRLDYHSISDYNLRLLIDCCTDVTIMEILTSVHRCNVEHVYRIIQLLADSHRNWNLLSIHDWIWVLDNFPCSPSIDKAAMYLPILLNGYDGCCFEQIVDIEQLDHQTLVLSIMEKPSLLKLVSVERLKQVPSDILQWMNNNETIKNDPFYKLLIL